MVCECMEAKQYNDVVQTELLAALRNFTRSKAASNYVKTKQVPALVQKCLNSGNDKIRQFTAETLGNMSRIP